MRQQLSSLVRDLNSSLHLQPALMLLPHDYRMVARVGGTKWFVASIHQGQRRKQTNQIDSQPLYRSLCSAGSQGIVPFLDLE